MMKLLRIILFILACLVTQVNSLSAQADPRFILNKGQWPEAVLFTIEGCQQRVSLLKDGISFSAITQEGAGNSKSVIIWNQKFSGINKNCVIEGIDTIKTVYSYLTSNNSADWVIQPEAFRKVRYNNLYDGIDVCYYGINGLIEYDYILHPGSEIGIIKGYYEGVDKLEIADNGDLKITNGNHIQYQKAPVSWQQINGNKHAVDVSYLLINDTAFTLAVNGKYNPDYDLIIDPLFQMVWSSYTQATGASNNINYCFANAMDKQGNVYLTGMVDGTYPVTPGAYSGPGQVVPEIFVSKFSSDGTTLLYSTYLPGNSSEFGTDIAVDDSGRAYVTGIIDLNITGIQSFPSTANAYQPLHNQGSDAFLTVLNADGTGLVYSTFLGGNNSETGYGIALGDYGIAYVTGSTNSTDFPLVNSAAMVSGDQNAFVTKFDVNQSGVASVLYSTRFGGGSFSTTSSRSIAVDATGNAYITGNYQSSFGTPAFPVTPGAYNSVYSTGSDNMICYAAKLSASLPVNLSYCTFLAPGGGNAIAVSDNGDAFIAGETRTFGFPVTPNVLQPVHGQDALGNGNSDGFVMHLNPAGSALIYSTFLGGPEADKASGIAVNAAGEVYVSGIAQDLFPTSAGAVQQNNAGSEDFFVVHINADATAYGCGGSTYIGGSDEDYTGSFYDFPSPKISLLDHGGNNDTLSISSTSHSQDFPTTAGVYGPVKVNGIADQPVFFKLTCTTGIIPPAPVAVIQSQISEGCDSVIVDFFDQSQNNPTSWTWYFPGSQTPVSNQKDPQDIVYTTSGNYSVRLVACNNTGCDSTSVSLQLNLLPAASVDLGNDTTVCNSPVVVLAADTGYVSYEWRLNNAITGTNNDTLIANTAGEYTITVSNGSGCTAADTIEVTFTDPVANFTYEFSFSCDGILLKTNNLSSNAASYEWNFGDGTTSSENNPVHLYTAVNDITIQLVAINGSCTDTMRVSNLDFETPVAGPVPNIITPNGDGKNDCLKIANANSFKGCYELKIFNRWGGEVFTSDDAEFCWEGKSQDGKPLPESTYFYLLKIGQEKMNGTVLITR